LPFSFSFSVDKKAHMRENLKQAHKPVDQSGDAAKKQTRANGQKQNHEEMPNRSLNVV
jgi:hypothetical protein